MKKLAVKKWMDIDAPWFEVDGFSDFVSANVSIISIMDSLGIEYGACRSGEFTHRLRCPFVIHMDGMERTPSLYVSEEQNKFFCFGCHSSGGIFDFVSMYKGIPFFEAVKYVCFVGKIDLADESAMVGFEKKEKRKPEETVFYYAHIINRDIKNFVDGFKNKKEYNYWRDWADKKFSNVDSMIDNLSNDDWQRAREYSNKITKFISEKKIK